MATLYLMVGESGSGKSTKARQMVKDDSRRKTVRLNRDDMRAMIHDGECKSRTMEALVSTMQRNMAEHSLGLGWDVIIDDTNLNPNTRARWYQFAKQVGAQYEEVKMETPLDRCVARDSKREGKAKVGLPVVHRQFLDSGRLPIDKTMPIVIVDIDGTLAWNDGHRNPYDEELVANDKPVDLVVRWVKELAYGIEGNLCMCEHLEDDHFADNGVIGSVCKECDCSAFTLDLALHNHQIIIVSGRHSSCGEQTVWWLNEHEIPYDFIFMRHAWDNRPDNVVKQEILDSILKLVPKENIKLVLDDRPKVIRMWKENGLRVIPVDGACEEF